MGSLRHRPFTSLKQHQVGWAALGSIMGFGLFIPPQPARARAEASIPHFAPHSLLLRQVQ
jgi:hypothetical protein